MVDTASFPEQRVTGQAKWAVVWSIATYLAWSLATYLLEERDTLIQRFTLIGRVSYVMIANGLIGTSGAFWVLQFRLRSQVARLTQLGFQSGRQTRLTILAAVLCQ